MSAFVGIPAHIFKIENYRDTKKRRCGSYCNNHVVVGMIKG
jgi:hypothetical protein